MAVGFKEPQAQGRGIAGEHHVGIGIDARVLDQAFDSRRVDELVVGSSQVRIDVPENGAWDVGPLVAPRGHIHVDDSNPGIVKVLLEPAGFDKEWAAHRAALYGMRTGNCVS
jgi:hypothetical protein